MEWPKSFEIKIARFEQAYPAEAPDSYVVGFTVTCPSNGRTMYQDTRIAYTEVQSGSTDKEVASMAWARVESAFEPWAKQLIAVANTDGVVVGSVFVP